ncbi:MAG: anhydro-N-acetylmuramic acid kinase [Gammaproteobacteria bacterium]|jgi:anhydro-N-acetylmuramic acid kinase|nr:anhydro-N-acetylmuramic acid kinase [Gammaproteobacteria bacterium]
MMSELYIGLMSGTSADGINAALVDFSNDSLKLVHQYYSPFPANLRQAILSLYQPGINEIKRMGEVDVILGKMFANVVNILLQESKTQAHSIRAIGSHGQTIRHYPNKQFTLQIGDPNIITAETGITTIADFRRRDIAHGGQGAPLVPAFHQAIFAEAKKPCVILNIGGISNITLLSDHPKQSVFGFDCGPGNALLDDWAKKCLNQPYDKDGAWAAQGNINQPLLKNLLSDSFFKRSPPKSCGREYFNLRWLENYLPNSILPVDVQATLAALTTHSILDAVKRYCSQGEIFICGGGIHNLFLMEQLKNHAIPSLSVRSTHELGIDPDFVEAIAFAWLAKQTLARKTGNVTAVTGAAKTAILGGIYQA